jgi:hypothetical protein
MFYSVSVAKWLRCLSTLGSLMRAFPGSRHDTRPGMFQEAELRVIHKMLKAFSQWSANKLIYLLIFTLFQYNFQGQNIAVQIPVLFCLMGLFFRYGYILIRHSIHVVRERSVHRFIEQVINVSDLVYDNVSVYIKIDQISIEHIRSIYYLLGYETFCFGNTFLWRHIKTVPFVYLSICLSVCMCLYILNDWKKNLFIIPFCHTYEIFSGAFVTYAWQLLFVTNFTVWREKSLGLHFNV